MTYARDFSDSIFPAPVGVSRSLEVLLRCTIYIPRMRGGEPQSSALQLHPASIFPAYAGVSL